MFARFIRAALVVAALCAPALAQAAPTGEALKMLPERVGIFRGQAAPGQLPAAVDPLAPEDFSIVSTGGREYAAPTGQKFDVFLVKTVSSPNAYSLLTYRFRSKSVPYHFGVIEGLGVVGESGAGRLKFVKGSAVIHVAGMSEQADAREAVIDFARQLAEAIDGEAGEVPVLVQHLPEPKAFDPSTGYAVSLPVLKTLVGPEQPVLDAVSFEGGAEAAAAPYGDGRLVLIEFTTPQYATDNDARITQRIEELRAAGGPVPSAYRRVGNYAVFVFGVEDAERAAALIDEVKYEKDIRWLGRNPHEAAMRERFLTTTMGGVVLTTLKATGAAILLCLGVGGLFGGFIFLRRRARSADSEVYTDAGGMLRLDIEDINSRHVRHGGLIDGGVKK